MILNQSEIEFTEKMLLEAEKSFDIYVNNDETLILQEGIKMADKEVLVVASKVKA